MVPFVPHAYHPLGKASHDQIPGLERVDVSGSDDAYWRLFSQLWAAGETFCVIEQDMEVLPELVAEMGDCLEPWCSAPYFGPGHGELINCLGCVRFHRDLLAFAPDLLSEVGGMKDSSEIAPGHWRRLDARLSGTLRSTANVQPHRHAPALHHHVYDGRCACHFEHDDYPVDAEGRYVDRQYAR